MKLDHNALVTVVDGAPRGARGRAVCGASRIALPTDLTLSSLWLLNWRSSGLTTTTDTSSRLTRASSRGGHRNFSGSKPIVQNGLPGCVLPESPCPGQSTLIRSAPNSSLQARIFMPRIWRVSTERRHTPATPRRAVVIRSCAAMSARHPAIHVLPLSLPPRRS